MLAAVAAIGIAGHGGGMSAAAAPARLPNIVYILADDLGYGDVHALNPQRSRIPTPHLDALAAQGMVFTDAHSASAVCTPSRYGILTGRYAWRTRLQMGVFNALRDSALIPADRLTVAGFLRQHGYHTGGMGKWHLGWSVPVAGDHIRLDTLIADGPTAVGFDEYFCSDLRYFSPYRFTVNDRFAGDPLRNWTDFRTGSPEPLPEDAFDDVLPRTTNATIDYLARRAADPKPFFAYVAPMVPHTPLSVAKAWQGRSGLGVYADYVAELDFEVGRILAAIDRYGLADNTLVVFTSDNGCSPVVGFRRIGGEGALPQRSLARLQGGLVGRRTPRAVRRPLARQGRAGIEVRPPGLPDRLVGHLR